jgi:hypothetical protein
MIKISTKECIKLGFYLVVDSLNMLIGKDKQPGRYDHFLFLKTLLLFFLTIPGGFTVI